MKFYLMLVRPFDLLHIYFFQGGVMNNSPELFTQKAVFRI